MSRTPHVERPPGLPAEDLRAALVHANLPCLLMVLHHLTGDERWLNEPYLPRRIRGINDDDTGGLPESVQAEVRAAAAMAIAQWSTGDPVAVERPLGARLRQMMGTCIGDEVSDEYEEMMAIELGFAEPDQPPALDGDPESRPLVAVIGAGVGGLTTSLAVRRAGFRQVVLERNDDVGGVWLTNGYPGAGVDTPSFLYSWSFFPRIWSTYFAKRDEVLAYIREMAEHYDLRDEIRFNTTVERMTYDAGRHQWSLELCDLDGSSQLWVDAVVSAVGVFGQPAIPDLPGLDSFHGPVFHSSQWPADLDITGKRLAVVGSGASAMQIVPAVAGRAASVGVFQRSAQWIAPAHEYFVPVDTGIKWLMANVPYYLPWYRFRLAWLFGDKRHASIVKDPTWSGHPNAINHTSDHLRRNLAKYMAEQLGDRLDLVEASTPDYPPYGKRMLLDNGWYRAVLRNDVDLFPEAVDSVGVNSVTTASGRTWQADVLVLCTGFQAQRYLHPIEVRGRSGALLSDVWEDDNARAYLGLMVPDFPNMFFIYGPNTNSGGGSIFSLAESQARYAVAALHRMVVTGASSVEPSVPAYERYSDSVDAAHTTMVWTHPGLRTYYRNSRGRVVVNMPWRGVEYWQMIRRPDFEDLTLDAHP